MADNYDEDADNRYDPTAGGSGPVSGSGLNDSEDRAAQANSDSADSFGKGRDTGGAKGAFGRRRDTGGGRQAFGGGDDSGNAFGRGNEDGDAFGREGDTGGTDGAFGKSRERFRRSRGLLRNLSKSKLLIGSGVGAFVIILAVLLLLASSLKLPQISQNIENYEFARVTRQFSQNAQRVSDESLVVEAANDSTWSTWKARFTDPFTKLYSNIRDTTWGRLDDYRPSQVIKTLGDTRGLQLNFKASGIPGRNKIFTGATLDGQDYPVEQVTSVSRFVPGLNKILVFRNNLNFVQGDFFPALLEDMKTDEYGPLVRGAVANSILKQTGSSRIGWVLNKFKGLNETDDQTEASIQMYDNTEAGDTVADNAKTGEITAADEDAKNATAQEVSSWKPGSGSSDLQTTVTSGNDTPAINAAEADLDPSLFKSVLNIANPIYGIFTPICIIFDGSVKQSQPAIDNQMNQQENAFDQLAAEADQQKKGDQAGDDPNELGAAIYGTNSEVGDITQTVPYQRASGDEIDTSTEPSAEAGSGGSYDYSLLNAVGLSSSSAVGITANLVAEHMCGLLTSAPSAAAIAAANIALTVGTGGASEGAEETAGQGATDFVKSFVNNAVKNIFATKVETKGTTTIERSALNRAERFVFKQGVIVGGTYGLTEFAKGEVAARAGQVNNGLAQNTDLVNEADSGANIEGNKLEQQQMFGRPMTNSEVGQSDQSDQQFLSSVNQSKSFSQRYFALSNPDSLASHLALDLDASSGRGLLNSIFKLGASVLRPLGYFGSLLSFSGMTHAAANPATQHYGNVQFGWTADEETLIDSSPTYKPLENQEILDKQNTKVVQIAMTYAACFGYKYDSSGNGDMDPTDTSGDLQVDPSATLGNLLANGDIARDSNGNVINSSGAKCSPDNLSYDNTNDTNAIDTDPSSPQPNDLVFRWRLAMSFDTTLDQLINQQTVTSTPSSGPGSQAPSSSGYQNPFHDMSALTASRVDEGADFATASSVPVYAIGNGKVTVATTNSTFYPGSWITYKLSDGPAAGKDVYVAEGCSPVLVHVGDTVTSNTHLCDVQPSSIETGWALNDTSQAAAAYGNYIELSNKKSYATADGQNFTELLYSLGLTVKECYDFPGATLTPPLASGLPAWVSNPATNSGSLNCN